MLLQVTNTQESTDNDQAAVANLVSQQFAIANLGWDAIRAIANNNTRDMSSGYEEHEYFEFNSSDGDDDDYIIQYSITSMELSKLTAVNTTNTLEILESNTLIIKIGDRANLFQRNRRDERNLQTALNTFSRCTTAQQALIAEARTHAITASNDAVANIESIGLLQSTSTCPRYKQWFGDYNLT